jgi:hypothetical protein
MDSSVVSLSVKIKYMQIKNHGSTSGTGTVTRLDYQMEEKDKIERKRVSSMALYIGWGS